MSRDDFIRPSSLAAIALCPGRPTLEAAVEDAFAEAMESIQAEVEVPEAPEAALGTKVHAYVADGIRGWVLCQETGERGALWGDAIALACNEAQAAGLDSWSVRCVQLCMEFARDLITKYEIHPDNVLVEHALDMGDLFGFAKAGTADLVLVVPHKTVIVVDWKAGFIDQGDADDHDQLQAYAIAAAATFKAVEVLVYLYQPRAERHRRASGATFSAQALAKNRAWTEAVVRRARADDPELRPCFDACKHCKALTRCAAAKEWIMNAREAAALIGKPTDPDTWGDLCAVAKTAEKFAEDGIKEAKAWAKAGGEITGWGLQDSGSQTKIDAQKAIKLAREAGTFDQLLEFAAFGAGAAKVVPGIEEAVSFPPKQPSLKPMKATAVA
jgi:hypothetical protein